MNTEIFQGSFTSTGVATFINLPSDVDWIHVYNTTVLDAAGADTGAKFEWYRGLADGTGIEYIKTAATNALQIDMLANGGFSLFNDATDPLLGAVIAITGITAATPPVTTLVATAGLNENDVVKFINVPGAQQFGGIDFTIDTIVANTSFELPFGPTIAATGAVAGNIRRVNHDPMYYPRRRYVSAITQAANAVVTLTVTHGFNVGEVVRLQVPAAFAMTEMNNLHATITAVSAANNTITLDIDSTGFTAFAWPLTADVPFTPAQVVPLGDSEVTSLAATENLAARGIELAAGTHSPAGILNDVIYWVAGKSFVVFED